MIEADSTMIYGSKTRETIHGLDHCLQGVKGKKHGFSCICMTGAKLQAVLQCIFFGGKNFILNCCFDQQFSKFYFTAKGFL